MAPVQTCSKSEVDFEDMHVYTGFVGAICISIRQMLETVLCKKSGKEIKTRADSAKDLEEASKVLTTEFVVAEEGRSRSYVN